MKTRQWVLWTVMAMFVLSAIPASAQFGTYTYHYFTGTRNSWNFRYNGRVYGSTYEVVPANCASLTIELGYDGHSGYGDVDLYVRYGALPTTTTYTRRSIGNSYRERIQILNPPAGRYYVKLAGYSTWKTCYKAVITPKSTTNWRTDMLNRVNYYRRQYGRAALTISSRLQAAAQYYANDMAAKHYYGGADHHGSTAANWTMDNRILATGYRSTGWTSYGFRENIAAGQTSVASVMNSWWNSTGHRNNILASTMKQVGFGTTSSSDSYGRRWVQDFGYVTY